MDLTSGWQQLISIGCSFKDDLFVFEIMQKNK